MKPGKSSSEASLILAASPAWSGPLVGSRLFALTSPAFQFSTAPVEYRCSLIFSLRLCNDTIDWYFKSARGMRVSTLLLLSLFFRMPVKLAIADVSLMSLRINRLGC
ncbi:hypothetical protein NQZ79_g6619 [Umbelopsis isabellina]|nr:hypothetical protein NQZ79_g6619 [Umbelopsis isabellina]